MIRRVAFLTITATLAAIFYYISRFWDFQLWGREGLFNIEQIRPQGGLLARWLGGSAFAPFELLIWVLAIFLVLTYLQKLFDALTPAPKDDDHD